MHIKTFLTVKERKKKIAYENILKVFLFEDSPGNSLQQMFQQKTVIENRVFQFWRQVWTFYKRSRGWKDFKADVGPAEVCSATEERRRMSEDCFDPLRVPQASGFQINCFCLF